MTYEEVIKVVAKSMVGSANFYAPISMESATAILDAFQVLEVALEKEFKEKK